MNYRDMFQIDATLVANEFLDKYMPKANGDFVKVYLYILKNQVSGIDYGTIADALDLTEGDVRRAVNYWEQQGILVRGVAAAESAEKTSGAARGASDARTAAAGGAKEPDGRGGFAAAQGGQPENEEDAVRALYKRAEGKEALNRLSKDREFSQLLFIVQKYMSKILTDSEQQVFAYLYDGLHIPCEVLDYLVDYCVQKGKNHIKYIERVGLEWAKLGIRTVSDAKRQTRAFDEQEDRHRRKESVARSKKGMVRTETDYDSFLLEQVIRKME